MSAKHPLQVVLCWHMHQPFYRDPFSGTYQLPWTYLHGIKDYADMAAHLEANPQARAVVNFTPTLLVQLQDYAEQIRAHLREGTPISDPLLAALDRPALPPDEAERLALIQDCLRANRANVIDRFPAYRRLAQIADCLVADPSTLSYVGDQYLADLLSWYHLGWMGESVRRQDPRLQGLQEKGIGYTVEDRRFLLALIGELLEGLIQRYRRLAEVGQIELSLTPYAHPIAPLMLDLRSGREALPESALPNAQGYPDGEGRVRWHIEEGLKAFRHHFGFEPRGCWPAEGAVSEPTLGLLSEYGFAWTATGEGVLAHSLGSDYTRYGNGEEAATSLCHPFRMKEGSTVCFFRDDELSDLIGFQYSDWHPDDAVADLVKRLEGIRAATAEHPDAIVSIILDGENAWEHYPENGFHFLANLYQRLADHPDLELTTFDAALDRGVTVNPLPRLVAGSWVYGALSTWIGDVDKNRGWDLLVAAKVAYDEAVPHLGREARVAAAHQLALCEGSDWFWWFGDGNPGEVVRDFDRLYRLHLAQLYRLLGREPPASLAHALAHGDGGAVRGGGVMRAGHSARD